MTHRHAALALLAALSSAFHPAPAAAICACQSVLTWQVQAANANRDSNTDRLVEAIQAAAGQISAYTDKASAAAEKIQDASDLNASMRVREELRASAEGGRYDPAAGACGAMSAALRLAAPPAGPPPAATGADTQNTGRNYERCAGGNDEVCRGPGAVSAGIIEDRDRHQDTGGVLDPTSDLRVLLQQPTAGAGTGSDQEELDDAVWRLTQNIVHPFPPPPVTRAEARTPGGAAAVARRQSDAARRSAPAALLGWIQTRSAANLDMADWARRTAPEGYPYPIDDRISVRQFYDVSVSAGWRDPEWHRRVQRMSPEAVMREIALQTALANDLALLRLELDLHRAANEAALTAAFLDDS